MGHDSEFDQKRFSSIPISRQLLKQELELNIMTQMTQCVNKIFSNFKCIISWYISYLLHILDNTRYNGMKFICNFKIYGINLLATWSTEARKLLLLLKCRVSSLKYTEPRPVQLLTSTSLEIAGVLCRAKRKSELCHAALSTGRKYNSNFEVILGSRHQVRHR